MAKLEVGDNAPQFDLPNENGEQISLESLKGKHVVLYFYPKDDTPGCTQEGKDFTDNHAAFEAKNAVILGASKDSVAKHDKFKCKYGFPFSLVSDENSTLCEDYGVWKEKNMYGKKYMGIERTTFLIDPEGKITKIWNKVKVKGHVEEVLGVI